MAPELFNDDPHPSKASDVYALGMVIYEVDYIAFFGESVLKDYSAGFRARTTVLSYLLSSCTLDSLG